MQVILHFALDVPERRVQLAAVKALQAFCIANPEGQLALLSDLSNLTTTADSGESLNRCLC